MNRARVSSGGAGAMDVEEGDGYDEDDDKVFVSFVLVEGLVILPHCGDCNSDFDDPVEEVLSSRDAVGSFLLARMDTADKGPIEVVHGMSSRGISTSDILFARFMGSSNYLWSPSLLDVVFVQGCRAEVKKRAIQEEEKEEEATSDVDEFFALLQRIRETGKQFPALRKPNPTRSLTSLQAGTCNPVWRPSFEWEDFGSGGNGTRDVKPSPPENAEVLNLNSKRGVKRQSVYLDEKNNGDTEMPDLNLPSTPPVLQLFY
ncbi:hypothetical protein SUGI_0104790 [Cryptomeria japonica]|nr:hypothetical protein SUGI_0104790 [Cryptomeria japonica]